MSSNSSSFDDVLGSSSSGRKASVSLQLFKETGSIGGGLNSPGRDREMDRSGSGSTTGSGNGVGNGKESNRKKSKNRSSGSNSNSPSNSMMVNHGGHKQSPLSFFRRERERKGKEKDLSEMGLLPPSARSSLSNTSNEVDPNSSTSDLQTLQLLRINLEDR